LVREQVSLISPPVQPATAGGVHEKPKLAEVDVADVLEQEIAVLAQPAATSARSTWAHTSEVNCASEVPGASVKANGALWEIAGTVVHELPAQQVIAPTVAVQDPE
jgi:hypothetical protein